MRSPVIRAILRVDSIRAIGLHCTVEEEGGAVKLCCTCADERSKKISILEKLATN